MLLRSRKETRSISLLPFSEKIRWKSESERKWQTNKIEQMGTMDILMFIVVATELSAFQDRDISRQKIVDSDKMFSILNEKSQVILTKVL